LHALVAKFENGRGVDWKKPDFTGTARGQPSLETNPIRPLSTGSQTL
jgi:hypothetical protein